MHAGFICITLCLRSACMSVTGPKSHHVSTGNYDTTAKLHVSQNMGNGASRHYVGPLFQTETWVGGPEVE